MRVDVEKIRPGRKHLAGAGPNLWMCIANWKDEVQIYGPAFSKWREAVKIFAPAFSEWHEAVKIYAPAFSK